MPGRLSGESLTGRDFGMQLQQTYGERYGYITCYGIIVFRSFLHQKLSRITVKSQRCSVEVAYFISSSSVQRQIGIIPHCYLQRM